MKTKLFLLQLLFIISLFADAQSKDTKLFAFGIGGTAGLPVSDVRNYANLAYGIDLMAEISITPSFALTLSAGYIDFVNKSEFSTAKLGYAPFLAGSKYYFVEKFYGSAQVGISFSTDSSGGQISYAPGVGIKLSRKFDLLLKYQSALKTSNGWAHQPVFNSAFLGLRAGLTF